jgi:mannose-6-phosphate isomerase
MRLSLTQPLVFEPLFMGRIWGGRRLETVFGKKLPPGERIGESWEIVDRPEAQSVVKQGPFRGTTLHELWDQRREEIFGQGLPDTLRFPILIKLLDASEKLSLQVHPPPAVAKSLGGEPKSEFWYFVDCDREAEIFAGFRSGVDRSNLEHGIREHAIADKVHRLGVKTGDSFFVPSGRLHGIGAGSLLVEIQQNSDTTYRVYDWERRDFNDRERELHLVESLQSIRFDDVQPECLPTEGEELISCSHFVVEKWGLETGREPLDRPSFAIFVIIQGAAECGGTRFGPGDVFFVPAIGGDWRVRPLAAATSLLRITLPR